MTSLQWLRTFNTRALFLFVAIGMSSNTLFAKEQADDQQAMTVDVLESIIKRLDESYARQENMLRFTYGGHRVDVITDQNSNRMRIVIPIARAAALSKAELYRVMQANFDSALDARYAIAQEILWSTFIHPLNSLTEEDFLSGIGQTINIVTSFGSTYSSGVITFGAGDSNGILQRELLDELRKRGQSI